MTGNVKPGRTRKFYPYVTVEELRRDPALLDELVAPGAGSRFTAGSTEPAIAWRHLPKDGRVLECGPIFGMFTKLLQDEGYRDVHALDFVDLLRFPDRRRLTFHTLDLNGEPFPYPDGYFGGATAWGIVEHLENPFHFLREVHRVLKPESGILIMAVPNVGHILSRLLFLVDGVFPRWPKENNHIFILPSGIFEKWVLRYFDLLDTGYVKRPIRYYIRPGRRTGFLLRALNRMAKWFPANAWFGDYVIYVLRWKPFQPYA